MAGKLTFVILCVSQSGSRISTWLLAGAESDDVPVARRSAGKCKMSGKWKFADSPAVRTKLVESVIVLLVLMTAVLAYWVFRS